MAEFGPPQDEEELNQRAQGWNSFFDNLSSDPAAQAALFQFGAQLLQPMAVGQTPAGHFGSAAISGATAHQQTNQNLLQQQRDKAEASREERRLGQEDRRMDITEEQAERNRALEASVAKNKLAIEWYNAQTDRAKLRILASKASSEGLEFRADIMKAAFELEKEAALNEGRSTILDNVMFNYKSMMEGAGKPSFVGKVTAKGYDNIVYNANNGLYWGRSKSSGQIEVVPEELIKEIGLPEPPPGETPDVEPAQGTEEQKIAEAEERERVAAEAAKERKEKASVLREANIIKGRLFEIEKNKERSRIALKRIREIWPKLSGREQERMVPIIKKITKGLGVE